MITKKNSVSKTKKKSLSDSLQDNQDLVKELQYEKSRAEKYKDLYNNLESERVSNSKKIEKYESSIRKLEENSVLEKKKFDMLKMKYVSLKNNFYKKIISIKMFLKIFQF